MSANTVSDVSSIRQDGYLDQVRARESHSRSRERNSKEESQEDMSESWKGDATLPRTLKPRPPPPLPPVPLTISTGSLTFQDHRPSSAASISGDDERSLSHHAGPEYDPVTSSESSSTAVSGTQISYQKPRRRSYTKVLPLRSPQSTSPAELGSKASSYSPSASPSSSPMLPLAPHESFEPREIISVTDDSGAGWRRHTRVYDGGVCLACMASTGQDGHDSQGGFYGDNVPMDQRR
ncbi:Uu.00g095730.m01.CDS01 [Anthostomella pinea]|uniref:Uu.00g095730.m01.CDS01 n=1 Tax=Anthostomella pinea TaxID=933095 RepID=A0AAI8VBZ5_9PEZI|nr:Uu.00g095730.m01.CDS01 [Anthostomella pinea]